MIPISTATLYSTENTALQKFDWKLLSQRINTHLLQIRQIMNIIKRTMRSKSGTIVARFVFILHPSCISAGAGIVPKYFNSFTLCRRTVYSRAKMMFKMWTNVLTHLCCILLLLY